MKKTFPSLAVLFFFFFLLSCSKHNHSSEPVDPAIIVQTFITNSGITDSSQKVAVTNFVSELDNSSLWTKFLAIYPMLGTTSGSMKLNLKDPRDADEAYRLTFHGSPVFADTGVLFPTLADFADTHLPDRLLKYNNSAISYYSLTQNAISGYDMGCTDHTAPFNEFAIYHRGDAAEWFGYHAYGLIPSNTIGLFILSATSNDVKRYDNSVITNSKGSAPVKAYTNLPVLIGNVAVDSVCGQKVCALATVGDGLTDQEVITFHQIVQNFEAALKRN